MFRKMDGDGNEEDEKELEHYCSTLGYLFWTHFASDRARLMARLVHSLGLDQRNFGVSQTVAIFGIEPKSGHSPTKKHFNVPQTGASGSGDAQRDQDRVSHYVLSTAISRQIWRWVSDEFVFAEEMAY